MTKKSYNRKWSVFSRKQQECEDNCGRLNDLIEEGQDIDPVSGKDVFDALNDAEAQLDQIESKLRHLEEMASGPDFDTLSDDDIIDDDDVFDEYDGNDEAETYIKELQMMSNNQRRLTTEEITMLVKSKFPPAVAITVESMPVPSKEEKRPPFQKIPTGGRDSSIPAWAMKNL